MHLVLSLGLTLALTLGSFNVWAAGDTVNGKAVYARLCTVCHGATGKGDGVAAAGLKPKPKDLSVAKSKGDAYLTKVITKGGPAVGLSPLMAPVGASLSAKDLGDLLAFIQTL